MKCCGTCIHWRSGGHVSGDCRAPIPICVIERVVTTGKDGEHCPCYAPREPQAPERTPRIGDSVYYDEGDGVKRYALVANVTLGGLLTLAVLHPAGHWYTAMATRRHESLTEESRQPHWCWPGEVTT